MELSLSQVIIHKSEYDPEQVLSPWLSLVGTDFSTLLPTALGHLFLERADGTIWFLDTWRGALEQVASDYNTFRDALEANPSFQSRYLMVDVVADLVGAGMIRSTGRCFTPFVSPGVGGSMLPDNFRTASLRLHQIGSAEELHALGT
jgi:hypothetical protein